MLIIFVISLRRIDSKRRTWKLVYYKKVGWSLLNYYNNLRLINIIISISRIYVIMMIISPNDAKEYIYHLILFHEIYTIINNFIIIPKQEANHNISLFRLSFILFITTFSSKIFHNNSTIIIILQKKYFKKAVKASQCRSFKNSHFSHGKEWKGRVSH